MDERTTPSYIYTLWISYRRPFLPSDRPVHPAKAERRTCALPTPIDVPQRTHSRKYGYCRIVFLALQCARALRSPRKDPQQMPTCMDANDSGHRSIYSEPAEFVNKWDTHRMGCLSVVPRYSGARGQSPAGSVLRANPRFSAQYPQNVLNLKKLTRAQSNFPAAQLHVITSFIASPRPHVLGVVPDFGPRTNGSVPKANEHKHEHPAETKALRLWR
jgi:hypothetical protein